MDPGSLNTVEELVLGLGLAVTTCIGLGLVRRLLAYALSAGTFLVGLAAVAALFVYKPSRVYGWVEREADASWSHAPSSEEVVDRGIAALRWLEDRLARAKPVEEDARPALPSTPPAAVAGDELDDADPPAERRPAKQAARDRWQ